MSTTQTRTFQVHEIRHEVLITAPRELVWRGLVEETNAWWSRDYFTGRDAQAMRIEPVLGGRMFEDWGDGQGLVWGTVIGLRKREFLQVNGLIDKPFGGPAGLISTWKLEDATGGTKLIFEEISWGAAEESTRKSLDEGWLYVWEHCLRPWAESVAKK